jgi:Flp pilus assembly pilin Flp
MLSTSILSKFRHYIRSDAGVTAIEYGLIAGAMGVATALGMDILGPTVTGMYQAIADAF